MYVADLPPKYNLHIIAKEGCEDGRFLKRVLANPLGPLYNGSLDTALYRCAVPGSACCDCASARTHARKGCIERQQPHDGLVLSRESPYYGLEVHTHLQLLYSPLRVLTAEEADIVYALPSLLC